MWLTKFFSNFYISDIVIFPTDKGNANVVIYLKQYSIIPKLSIFSLESPLAIIHFSENIFQKFKEILRLVDNLIDYQSDHDTK